MVVLLHLNNSNSNNFNSSNNYNSYNNNNNSSNRRADYLTWDPPVPERRAAARSPCLEVDVVVGGSAWCVRACVRVPLCEWNEEREGGRE